MNDTTSATPRRRRRWLLWLSAVAVFALVQSITVTPSIDVRFVDEATAAPVPSLPVTATWQLQFTSPAGSMRSTTLKVQRLSTDANGEIDLGFSVMVHAPAFPFGFHFRDAGWLPTLYVLSDRYDAHVTGSSGRMTGEPHPWSFLMLQRSPLSSTTIRLSPSGSARDPAEQRSRDDHRSHLNHELYQADQACRKRMLCQRDTQ